MLYIYFNMVLNVAYGTYTHLSIEMTSRDYNDPIKAQLVLLVGGRIERGLREGGRRAGPSQDMSGIPGLGDHARFAPVMAAPRS